MMIVRNQQKAASTIEYVLLIIIFVSAIFLMQKQIARSFFGRWKDLGDGFGYGEQYDPKTTTECGRYVDPATQGETWYLQKCYECCFDVTVQKCISQGFQGDVALCRKGTVSEQKKCCAAGCNRTTSDCAFDAKK